MCFALFYRTFATETSQFLAPYEVSQKNRSSAAQVTTPAAVTTIGLFTSEQNVQHQTSSTPLTTTVNRPCQLSSSMSNSELSKCLTGISGGVGGGDSGETLVRRNVAQWNPFEDPTPFSQMTEDHIFDAEFEAIRQRGSQSSKCWFFCCYY